MCHWAMPPKPTEGDKGGGGAVNETPPAYIPARSISVPFGKAWLADEADIEEYLAVLRKAYMDAVNEGKRIQV